MSAKSIETLLLEMQKRKGRKSSSYNKNNARFMQPLISDFLYSFSIPVSFMRHLESELKGHPLKTVVLMTEPRRQWVVEVEDGRYLKDGWPEFCLYHHLGVGDFLVFTYQNHFLFRVSVFDPATACERHFPDATGSTKTTSQFTSSSKRKPLKTVAEAVQLQLPLSPVQSQLLSCQIKFTAYAFKRKILYLPMHFVRSSGLHNRKCDLTLVDGEERHWEVGLSCRKSNGQPFFMQEWRRVQVANCFKPGDIITLQLVKAGEKPILKCYSLKQRREFSNFERKPSTAATVTQVSSLRSQSPNCHTRFKHSDFRKNNAKYMKN